MSNSDIHLWSPEGFRENHWQKAEDAAALNDGGHVILPLAVFLDLADERGNIEAGRMAAQTLIDRGYKHVAFLGGPRSATSTQDRFAGFAEVIGPSNVEMTVSYASNYSFDAGREEMQRLLRSAPAEAYFCGDDVLSIGVLSAITDAGLSVPQDIGIIGLNDMEMAAWANINLTTIRNPIKQIIASSIELIEASLKDDSRYPEARLFACTIVERGTLRPLPT